MANNISLPFQPSANAGSGQGIDLSAVINFLRRFVPDQPYDPKTGTYAPGTPGTTPAMQSRPNMRPPMRPMGMQPPVPNNAGAPFGPPKMGVLPTGWQNPGQMPQGPPIPQQRPQTPLARAITQPAAPPPDAPLTPASLPAMDDSEGANGPANDSLAVTPPPPLPGQMQQPSISNIPGGLQASALPPGLSGGNPSAQMPQGGGDLMSLISRLLHMHGH